MKKIAIIGSTCYKDNKMKEYKDVLTKNGYEAKLPAFDCEELTEYDICSINKALIEWADEVHIFWDGRSLGTVFDCGMAFALRKPIKLVYHNPKQFLKFMEQYEYISNLE